MEQPISKWWTLLWNHYGAKESSEFAWLAELNFITHICNGKENKLLIFRRSGDSELSIGFILRNEY